MPSPLLPPGSIPLQPALHCDATAQLGQLTLRGTLCSWRGWDDSHPLLNTPPSRVSSFRSIQPQNKQTAAQHNALNPAVALKHWCCRPSWPQLLHIAGATGRGCSYKPPAPRGQPLQCMSLRSRRAPDKKPPYAPSCAHAGAHRPPPLPPSQSACRLHRAAAGGRPFTRASVAPWPAVRHPLSGSACWWW